MLAGSKIVHFFEIINPAFPGTPRWLVWIRRLTIFVVLIGIVIEYLIYSYFD